MLCQRDGTERAAAVKDFWDGWLGRQAGRQKLQKKWWKECKGLCEITDLQGNHIKLQRDRLKKQIKKKTPQEL